MSRPLPRSSILGALCLALLVCVAVSGPAQAAPTLERCEIGAKRPFRCGHISVPNVRGAPELGNRPIGFALRPASDRSRPSRGTIVFVEGGPGYAATNFDAIRPLTAVFAPFLRRYDLLAIDQRGTGRSRPLNCPGLQRGRVSASKGLRACAEQLGPLYQGYTTAESAADVEAVRQALGIERSGMILYGDSYGTYLGQSYAARYGQGMRGLILSSAYPITGESPFWPSLYPAARRALRLACVRYPECSGDALGRFDRVLRRAGTRSAFTRQVLVFLMMSASSYAPGSYRRLNRAVSAWLEGRPRRLRLMTDPGPPGSGPPGYFSEGMYAAVVCNDYQVPWDRSDPVEERRAELRRRIQAFRPRDLFAPLSRETWAMSPASGISSCLPWPGPTSLMEPAIKPGQKMPAGLDTLVIAGEFDAITTAYEARKTLRFFPRGRYYEARNRGHASELYFPFTSPVTDRIRGFVSSITRKG